MTMPFDPDTINIKYKLVHPDAKPLEKNYDSDMAYDIFVVPDEEWERGYYEGTVEKPYFNLLPGKQHTFKTGMIVAAPDDHGFLLRDRSGLAHKNGIHILAGVIEGTYRDEWGIVVINLGEKPFIVKSGDKLAQAVLTKIIPSRTMASDDLGKTERGKKGFGSSGDS